MQKKQQVEIVYEMTLQSSGEWVVVDDDTFMMGLYRTRKKVTPVIKNLLEGQIYWDGKNSYRLKFKRLGKVIDVYV